MLVYRTERRGTPFTWALLLTPLGADCTELRLRFRGQLRSTGSLRRLMIAVGGTLDAATGGLMIRGLKERIQVGSRGRAG